MTAEPLDPAAITALVGDPGAGAIVTFQGTTRDVDKLDVRGLRGDGRAADRGRSWASAPRRHGLRAAAAEHRIGDVPLGEPSVVVAVSAAHRGEAFAGAREAIDRIKAEAPIWKKESRGRRRESWVEGAVP